MCIKKVITELKIEESPITIILGTAHLSSTPGKRSPDGKFREYKFSREVCLDIQKELIDMGYNCVIDYIDDDMENPKKELEKRCEIVNNICKEKGAKNCLYVSIHANAAGNGKEWKKAYGWSVWTTKGKTNSDKLGLCLYDAAVEVLTPLNLKTRKDRSDGDDDYESNFYVIKYSNCPAVLTENMFQDCQEECEFLLSETGKKAIVLLHVNGILNYLKNM